MINWLITLPIRILILPIFLVGITLAVLFGSLKHKGKPISILGMARVARCK